MTDDLVLAIIPARGGSRDIPSKNIVHLGGRPLIDWTIAAAIESTTVDRVVVSTDDDAIAKVAEQCGAEVPFMRPAHLASDDTPGVAPILDVAHRINEAGIIVTLQPTSPFRTAEDIDSAVRMVRDEGGNDFCVSVVNVKHHPNWSFRMENDGQLRRYEAGPLITRRQDLPTVFALNGAVYVARREALLEQKTLVGNRTVGSPMPAERSIDIDTPADLQLAEALLTIRPEVSAE